MDQRSTTSQEQAHYRIQQRRRRQAKRRRQRRLTLIACCAALVLVCVCVFRFLPFGAAQEPASSDPADVLPGGAGDLVEEPEENFDHVDITPQDGDSEQMLALKELAVEEPRVKKIIDNIEAYPEDLITLVLKTPETVDFVADYPEKGHLRPAIDLSEEASGDEIPLLIQWDERWGYQEYGSGMIGWTGCGPTCMSMLALYFTGNEAYDPVTVAQWAEDNGYYVSGSGTSWTFMSEGCAHFGLKAEELPLVKQYMINAIEEGRPIVCAMAPGDFTTNGHYIILTGYDEERGFTVNDPNSPIRSGQYWTYEVLEGQISNLWAIDKA